MLGPKIFYLAINKTDSAFSIILKMKEIRYKEININESQILLNLFAFTYNSTIICVILQLSQFLERRRKNVKYEIKSCRREALKMDV